MRLRKTLILALMCIALGVFLMQVARLRFAWIGVSLYWLVLTIKNYVDWRNRG